MRLIDAEFLTELIAIRVKPDKPELVNETFLLIVDLLKAMPTIDAEPVVRCEYCEHYSGGICWHPYITGSCDCDVEKEPDGYCDWGKRKDGESCG